jgi:polygalacturonase
MTQIMSKRHLLIVITALLTFFNQLAHAAASRVVITDLGAVGDGTTMNTRAIQSAIDRCATGGGGTVVIPTGGTFMSGAIFLKQGVNLLVEKDAMLKGSNQLEDYLTPAGQVAAFVNADGLHDVEIGGHGTIDGNGRRWWDLYWQLRRAGDPQLNAKTRRPRLIKISNCKDVHVHDLHLQNQAVWCLHLQFCENCRVEDLTVRAPNDAPSSDGIDVDSCKHVHILACDIVVNDDCISIKAGSWPDQQHKDRPSEDILIEECRLGYGHGGIDIGSETYGGIRNVDVRDCVVDNGNLAAIRFKTTPSRSGVVENITFQDIHLRDVRRAFEINMDWRSSTSVPEKPADVLPVFRNIKLISVSGGPADSAGIIHGLPDSPIDNIKFLNCNVNARTGLTIDNANNVDTSGLRLNVQEGQAIIRKAPSPQPAR